MVLLGLAGLPHAGVKTVANILTREPHNFTAIVIRSDTDEGPQRDDETEVSNTIIVDSVESALEVATPRWQEHFVLFPLRTKAAVDVAAVRPFFYLTFVDAPLLTRFARHQERDVHGATETLESWVAGDDAAMYSQGLRAVMSVAQMTVMNDSDLATLAERISAGRPTLKSHCLPDWDTYFMKLSFHASRRSNCMKRRVGAVLVKNNRVVATGYNGTPRGTKNCNEGGCARCNGCTQQNGAGLEYCFCTHAEENAIIEAGRERGDGCTLYTTTFPCLPCAKKIIQVGVKLVVYHGAYHMDDVSRGLLSSVGIEIRHLAGEF